MIPSDELEALIELGLSMKRIVSILGVSERTIRQEMYGLTIGREGYSALADNELDLILSDILQVCLPMCNSK